MKQFEDGVKGNQQSEISGGSANTENTLTIAAVEGHFHVLDSFTFSCDADPAKGTLVTISFGAVVKWKHFITNGGPGPVDLGALASGVKNEAVTIVASAAGATISVNLSAKYR